MSDRDAVLTVLNAIPGEKTVTATGVKFHFPGDDKRLLTLVERLDVPIRLIVRRQLDDTYLNEKNEVKSWVVVYGLLLDDKKINVIDSETLQRHFKKTDGVLYETLDIHTLLVNLLAGSAEHGIGDAAAAAYKTAIKTGDCTDACNAAIDAAAEAAKRTLS